MRRIVSTTSLLLLSFIAHIGAQSGNQLYHYNGWGDGIYTGVMAVGAGIGFQLIQKKKGIDEVDLMDKILKKDKINVLDRWLAGRNSELASKNSDIPLIASFASPLILVLNKNSRSSFGVISALYLESLATTGALYSMTAGLVNRSRPYVYDESESIDRRLRNNGQRSFYSGHVAFAATAAFFTAKVLHDASISETSSFLIWPIASILPLSVGFYRIRAGQHFLTDVGLGFVLGAATGILVPELHKNKDSDSALHLRVGTMRLITGDSIMSLKLSRTISHS